jgi:hypothetical protein
MQRRISPTRWPVFAVVVAADAASLSGVVSSAAVRDKIAARRNVYADESALCGIRLACVQNFGARLSQTDQTLAGALIKPRTRAAG